MIYYIASWCFGCFLFELGTFRIGAPKQLLDVCFRPPDMQLGIPKGFASHDFVPHDTSGISWTYIFSANQMLLVQHDVL